jgi:hypothetical protein
VKLLNAKPLIYVDPIETPRASLNRTDCFTWILKIISSINRAFGNEMGVENLPEKSNAFFGEGPGGGPAQSPRQFPFFLDTAGRDK